MQRSRTNVAIRISIIIPALNAANALQATLAAVSDADEIVVVDGGSSDATCALARASGAALIAAPRGRGAQLRAGALAARYDWLLFLHADTVLAHGWREACERFAACPEARAGAFRFALDDSAWQARLLERLVNFRTRLFGLPYGDQGLFIHRTLFDAVGGYKTMPLMEDVDIVRRLGKRRLEMLPHTAVTSAERWRRRGWLAQTLRNQICLMLFFLGVSPERIQIIYERR